MPAPARPSRASTCVPGMQSMPTGMFRSLPCQHVWGGVHRPGLLPHVPCSDQRHRRRDGPLPLPSPPHHVPLPLTIPILAGMQSGGLAFAGPGLCVPARHGRLTPGAARRGHAGGQPRGPPCTDAVGAGSGRSVVLRQGHGLGAVPRCLPRRSLDGRGRPLPWERPLHPLPRSHPSATSPHRQV